MKKSTALTLALSLAPSSVPGLAFACGGLFCNNSSPIVQSGEQILFAQEDDSTIQMHVLINYAGPPQDFGWILPTPRGVTTTLSTQGLFSALTLFQPAFYIGQTEKIADCMEQPRCIDCEFPSAADRDSEGAGGQNAGGGGVDVISREIVGPYDRVILSAESVMDLRLWLDENGYQIPESADEKLLPYIGNSVFVAIKLVGSADANDIVPLALTFPGDLPSIPIVPTSVAATPDMGIVVYVLGSSRAIPANYLHVQINEAAIDWASGGGNYFDVVAQAADEANGKAFATDFAGPHGAALQGAFDAVPEALLDRISGAMTMQAFTDAACEQGLNFFDADIRRVLTDILLPPTEAARYCDSCIGCLGNAPDDPINGAELAARLRMEVNEPRVGLTALFGRHPYLTRLFSTMSPEEMNEDPAFTFGRQLPDVQSARIATQLLDRCDAEGYYDYANYGVRTPSGVEVRVEGGEQADAIARQDGRTVRQGDEPGAAVIEQLLTTGGSAVKTDNLPAILARHRSTSTESGCGCRVTRGGAGWSALGLAALLLLRRRRRYTGGRG